MLTLVWVNLLGTSDGGTSVGDRLAGRLVIAVSAWACVRGCMQSLQLPFVAFLAVLGTPDVGGTGPCLALR